jgi:hypothetical protein
VIADPPVFVGAVKLTTTPPLLPLAAMPVGAPGAIAAGVTEDDALEAVPVPTELVAVTVKVYVVPLVSPVTVIGDEGPVARRPPGEDVTVYPVIADPPVFVGAVKLTVALPLMPVVTATPIGAPGSVGGVTGGVTGASAAGVTAAEALDAVPVPMAFVAATVNV